MMHLNRQIEHQLSRKALYADHPGRNDLHGHDACPDELIAATSANFHQPEQHHTQQKIRHHAGSQPQLQKHESCLYRYV